MNHLDDEVGSIEIGKAADLAVLDRDLFDAGRVRSATRGSSGRSIDGEVAVYERPELGG